MNSGKKSKTRDHDRACFPKKIRSVASHHLYMFLCFGIFFRKARSVTIQKMVYIFVQHGIIPHILAYAIWNWHHKIGQLTLYLHVLFLFSNFKLWRHQQWFWIFSRKRTRWWSRVLVFSALADKCCNSVCDHSKDFFRNLTIFWTKTDLPVCQHLCMQINKI